MYGKKSIPNKIKNRNSPLDYAYLLLDSNQNQFKKMLAFLFFNVRKPLDFRTTVVYRLEC